MKKSLKIAGAVFGALVILGAIGSCGKSDPSKTSQPKTEQTQSQKEEAQKQYTEVSSTKAIDLVEKNGLKASKEYKGKDLKITNCKIGKIDSDGDGILFESPDRDFTLAGIYTKVDSDNKELQDQIANLSNGQIVTVYMHVNDVGDTLGLRGSLDKIEVNK